MLKYKCAICGKVQDDYGNSTWGYWDIDETDVRGQIHRCCNNCNMYCVIPARMGRIPKVPIEFSKYENIL